jgi:hypothetical protein
MASIGSASHASLNNVPRRSYIAMNSYTNDLFGYSLTFNPATFTNVGSLSNLGVPVSSTLQGSILSETGKKLYPGASDGVSTLMVSVYDQTSKVTGFINPNSPTFAIFTTDKPPYMGQGTDPGTDGRTNLGNSIYTHGSVIADGFGTYNDLLSTGQSLTVGTTARIGQSLSTGTSVTIGSTLSVRQSISTGTSITCGTGLTSFNGQNRVTNISTYTSLNGAALNLDLEGGQVMNVVVRGSGGVGVNVFDSLGPNQSTINGSLAYMVFNNTNTAGTNSTIAITFGNNLRETNSLTTQPASTYTVSFVAGAGTMFEIARAGPLQPG